MRSAKPNTPNKSFFHSLDDIYVGSDARNENRQVQFEIAEKLELPIAAIQAQKISYACSILFFRNRSREQEIELIQIRPAKAAFRYRLKTMT